MSSVASTAPNGSHYAHASTGYVGGPQYACSVCHTGYSATTVTTTTHVNKQVDLGFTGNGAGTTYSKAAPITAGTAWGSCSTSKCHGQATGFTWGSALWKSGSDHCSSCHSSNAAGAVTAAVPFYSTEYPVKQTANTNAKVGAHTSHLTSTDSLTGNLTCTDCHGSVTLATATHMSGATNFSWSALATKNGALTPTYNATTGQCSNVYCHGASMPGGDSSGTNRTPTWNVPFLTPTISAAACGSCHGFPPSPASGHPAVTLPATWPTTGSATGVIGTTCSCHANINPAGNSYATIFVDKSLHLNANLEVSGGSCDSCHGYPPARPGFKGTLGNWSSARQQNYSGGGGAHTVANHVSRSARPNGGFANCDNCHNPADHNTGQANFLPKVRVDQQFRMVTAKQARYSSNRLDGAGHVAGTCSNISCHFGATPAWNQR
jgi:predicted CxxxxCH...CXXCH cytochrome family protein